MSEVVAEPGAPEAPSSLSVGDVVGERYRIEAVLGEGGMGIVYRVEHMHLRKAHALKVLLPEWSSMPEVVARFEREAVAAGRIESPHVAAATDFGRLPTGSFFLVMEFVDGRTLRDALDAGPLPPDRAFHVVRGIAAGLQAAHACNIVHRDMKPENVMLIERDGDPDFVKVLDFGVAKVDGFGTVAQTGTSSVPLTRAGAVIGTPDYMSPEQALGQAVDARSDLYAVGVMLFEMLTGRCPYRGGAVTVLGQHVTAEIPELPADLAASLDPRLQATLRRLLAKEPQDRFASTAELVAALDACDRERERPAPAPPAPAVTPWLRTLEGVARRALADPRTLLPYATRGRLIVTAVAIVVLVSIVVLVAGSSAPAAPSASGAGASSPSIAPASPSTATMEVSPLPILPPPPAPSSSPSSPRTRPAPSQGASRQTGPGGIYIPPPSQWFR
jgi:serine/threonine protein kinase